MQLIKIENQNGINVVSSRTIAEQLGKEHSKVIRSIENILEIPNEYGENEYKPNVASSQKLFIESNYIASNGKPNKEYLLTKDGFTLYMFNIQGYNEFKMAYINKFNEMEQALQQSYKALPRNYKEALAHLIIAEEEKEKLEIKNHRLKEKIELDSPKVLFAESLLVSDKSILVNELAKLLIQNGIDIGGKRLFKWLRANNYLCTRGEERNLPTQRSMNMGLMEVKRTVLQNSDGSSKVIRTPKITPKGQQYFVNKFVKAKNLLGLERNLEL